MADIFPIQRLLIANRGEIACRIMRTAKAMGMHIIAVYSEADAGALHVELADEAYLIGPAEATKSYLNQARILSVAKKARADAIHPGYGFLAENAEFAEAVQKNGIVFVGPNANAIRAMGFKDEAKILMEGAGVPVVPGYHGEDQNQITLHSAANNIGYPVLIKAVAGGGGKGMRKVETEGDFIEALESCRREALSSFGDDRVLVEKYIAHPRHIEIQVFADTHGNVVHLFERDCSVQRRHQKIIEEAPAPGMTEKLRAAMGQAAVEAVQTITYSGAGTVEFIVDASKGLGNAPFYFMEMNTRLQVEHPVTEEITGQDLVEWQLRVAAGEPLPLAQKDISISGHALEVRLYAEDPANEFLPANGTLTCFRSPEHNDFRLETGVLEGDQVSIFYDPMIAKLVTCGSTRKEAIERMGRFLSHTRIAGVQTNAEFLLAVLNEPDFKKGQLTTHFIDQHRESLLDGLGRATDEDARLAALALLLDRKRLENINRDKSSDPASPWHDSSHWRMNFIAPGTIELLLGDQQFRVRVVTKSESFEILAEGKILTAHGTLEGGDDPDEADELVAQIDGVEYSATTLIRDEAITLMHRSRSLHFRRLSEVGEEDDEAEGPGHVMAPMPGKILEVRVKTGDQVSKDQSLVIMEAMKMEYTLKAPRSGVIERVNVKPGEQVKDAAELLVISET